MTTPTTTAPLRIIAEIASALADHHGRSNEAPRPSLQNESAARQFASAARRWSLIDGSRRSEGTAAWDSAVLAATYQALAATEADLRRTHLIRLAATALIEISSIDAGAPLFATAPSASVAELYDSFVEEIDCE